MEGKRSHKAYTRLVAEPLKVEGLLQAGQSRVRRVRQGIDRTTRMYRVIPLLVDGYLVVTYDQKNGQWDVVSTLGSDMGGHPLLCIADLAEVVGVSTNWNEMEANLATYFSCGIYEFHFCSPGLWRLRVPPPKVDGN